MRTSVIYATRQPRATSLASGWNYCWSNCATAGISYAPDDALIYRQGNYVWKLIYSAVDYPGVLRSEIGSVLLLR